LERVKNKELVIKPAVSNRDVNGFLSKMRERNIKIIYFDPKFIQDSDLKTIYPSEQADIVICKTINELKKFKSSKKICGYNKKVLKNDDLEEIVLASEIGADLVIVETDDWKIIPLENIIARLHKTSTKIYTIANSTQEVRTMFSILELGVDGVIFSTDNENEIDELGWYLQNKYIHILPARILEVKEVGIGDRVCIDTASMLNVGECMLVGSRANFLFLVHNESVGSSFTSPRPFRVNAGAVYCYTLLPDGKTKYLSEIESGAEILIVNSEGASRHVTVGRSKTETRPLKLVKAETNGEIGTIILQNAETIRLVTKEGKLLSVTEVKIGDEILAYIRAQSGRHFGMEVDEFILEK
jgi:3-dehydroquinate synthase II